MGGLFKAAATTASRDAAGVQSPSPAAGRSSTPVHLLLMLAGVAWGLSVLLAQYPGYTHFDTAEIYMWSRLGFVWNVGRHPPLLPWLVHAVDLVVPVDRHWLLVIAVANMLVGAFAVWRVARLVVGVDRAGLALVLLGLMPYTTWLALKLNHNAILISLWPLTAWAFLACLRCPTWAHGILFGIAAAAGVLAKYYVLLLLLAAFVASLWWPRRKAFYSSPAPYVAVLVFCLLLAPHVYVTYIADGDAFSRMFRDADYARPNPLVHALAPGSEVHSSSLRVLRANLVALLPMIVVFGLLLRRQRGASGPQDRDWDLFAVVCLLCAVPYAATIVIAMVLGLAVSANWTSPIFTLLPVVLAGWLAPPTPELQRLIVRTSLAAFVVLPLASPLVLYWNFRQGSPAAVAPRAEIARDGAAIWTATTGLPVRIIGPDQPIANTASLELPSRPLAWPAFNLADPTIPRALAERHGVLGLCPEKDEPCRQQAAMVAHDGIACRMRHSRRLWNLTGPEHVTNVYLVPPKGVRLSADTIDRACRAANAEKP